MEATARILARFLRSTTEQQFQVNILRVIILVIAFEICLYRRKEFQIY